LPRRRHIIRDRQAQAIDEAGGSLIVFGGTGKREACMQENAAGYYVDFFVYPAVLVALALYTFLYAGEVSLAPWLVMAAAGVALWTLTEYLMHRLVLHNVAYFKSLHDAHHDNPKALIDTPIWASLTILIVVVLTPSYWALGPGAGLGFTFGMTLGYVVYSVTHHAMHFWSFPHNSYLYRCKHRHALHHYSQIEGNFGVTTPFWDYVFGTALPEPQLVKQAHAREG
jgi:sterol desaturase/sphingolipid hydroxylase (fatty acid hydroxylase superfamily)